MSTIIYDPAAPPLYLDGLLDVYSTCRDCGTLMKVIHAEQHSHPTCVTVQTQLESLADLYVSEVKAGDDDAAYRTEELMETVRNIELGDAATDYAEWGWPVFPLARHLKVPAISKDNGGNGFKDATSDPTRIKKWWTRHPLHNIGLATGHAFDVIDIDTKDKDGKPSPVGVRSFNECLEDGSFRYPRNIEVHGVAVTASGGLHLYVKPTGKNAAGIRPGIDYRGRGGYVVAPPSVLTGNRGYTWLIEPSPAIKEEF